MAHYVAIIEDAGPDRAVGVWFPDLPGCTSGGDDIDEALRNAPEALELYAESLEADGRPATACTNPDRTQGRSGIRRRYRGLHGCPDRIALARPCGGVTRSFGLAGLVDSFVRMV
jgi:predicted RNase H-like HicB family nuclease